MVSCLKTVVLGNCSKQFNRISRTSVSEQLMVNSLNGSLLQTCIAFKTILVSASSWPQVLSDLSRSAKFEKQVLSTTTAKSFSKLATSLSASYLVSSLFVSTEGRNFFVSRWRILVLSVTLQCIGFWSNSFDSTGSCVFLHRFGIISIKNYSDFIKFGCFVLHSLTKC